MQSIKTKFQLATKPAFCLAGIAAAGLLMFAYGPREWLLFRVLGAFLQMFCMGVLAAQHMSIWEAVSEKPVEVPAPPAVATDWDDAADSA